MRRNKILVISAMVVVGAIALSACADSGSRVPAAAPAAVASAFAVGSTMTKLSKAGKITIGTDFDAPFFGLAGPDRIPIGFEVDIAKRVAAELGIKPRNITWVEAIPSNRERLIEDGTVDLVVATYTITDARKQLVSFAGPYYEADQDLMVLAGNPANITGADDLAGKPVCTVSGSTSQAHIEAFTTKVLAVDTYSACLAPLRSGEVVAITTDNVVLAGLADQNSGEFEVLDKPFTTEPYGIGLARGDSAFRGFLNDVLDESFADGSWAAAWKATGGTVLETPLPPALDRY